MNRADFQYGGGFPLKSDTLDFLQATMLSGFSAIAKNLSNSQKVILTGCDITGESGMSTGYVIINNEILPIDSGDLYPNTGYQIIESSDSEQFKDGTIHSVYFTRKVVLVNTNPNNNFNTDFTRLPSLFNLPKIKQGSEYFAENSLDTANERTIAKGLSGNYVVLGSFRGQTDGSINLNFMSYSTFNHTSNSFKLAVNSLQGTGHPAFYFDYILIQV